MRFKPQSIWEQYRWYIVAALIFMLVQSTMIVALAVQRRRMRKIQAVLRESRQLVELATSAAEVGLWSRDPFRGEMWANAPLRTLFGFGAQQMLRIDDVMERIHPDDRARVAGELDRAQAAGLPFETEYRIRLPDGVERWVLAKGRSMSQLGGHDSRRMGVVLDITERKRAEAQLRESEDRLRRLVESTRVVIWQADPETWAMTYVSPYAEQLLGYPLARWYEKDFWVSHIHPEDRMRAIETCLTMSKTAEDFDFEYRMIDASGEAVWIHDLVNCQHQDSRMQLRGLMFDITERKRSEQALRQTVTDLERAEESLEKQRTFLRQVIDVNPNFIFAKDREGHFTLANRAVAEAYGVSVDELIGKTDADFNANAEEVEFFRRMDRQVMDTLQERFIPEERVTDARGKVHWLQTVKRPIIESDGLARQVLGTSTDITQRKQTEMELQELRAELAHVARVSLMGELAASLAHELNQPLTAILSNASAALRTLSRGPVDPHELREILQDIVEANNRAAEVIRHMRALVKKEETLDFESLDLADLIGDVAALVHNDAVMQDIRIDLDVAADLPRIRGDRVQLQQVVLNLLLNAFDAVKAAPAGERQVRLRAERSEGGMNLVAVSDRGGGLSSEDLDKVFQPFYTTKREGLGMGLSICRSIIEAHGGTLRAENNRDGGATFYFTVPVETAAGTD